MLWRPAAEGREGGACACRDSDYRGGRKRRYHDDRSTGRSAMAASLLNAENVRRRKYHLSTALPGNAPTRLDTTTQEGSMPTDMTGLLEMSNSLTNARHFNGQAPIPGKAVKLKHRARSHRGRSSSDGCSVAMTRLNSRPELWGISGSS